MKLLLLFLAACAVARADKIVNGDDAVAGQVPFIVRLNRNNFNYCDGSIYNEYWIISAAHCKQSSLIGQNIVAGDLHRLEDDGTEQKINMKQEITNCDYSSISMHNDIMVIKLESPLDLKSNPQYVAAIPLPDARPANGSPVFVAGWGATSSGGETSDMLQYVVVDVVSQADCQSAYHTANITRIFEGSLCLAAPGKDSCQGDSGGPAYTGTLKNGVTLNPELVGIVSWGFGCADPYYPGVYTDVFNYKGWIENAVYVNDVAEFGCTDNDGIFHQN